MSWTNIFGPYLIGSLAALLAYLTLKRWATQHALPVPPGPRPLPIIGNLLDIPRHKEWLTYRSWNEKFGDVVYVEALGQKIVVLGTAKAVNDLMDRRGTIYSDRPVLLMMNEIMDFKWMLAVSRYGERWRRGRKLLHTHFHVGAAPSLWPAQLKGARRLVVDLLASDRSPTALPHQVRLNFAQIITKIVYGIDIQGEDDEYIGITEKVLEAITVGQLPGRFLVDYIPLLQHLPDWFPSAGFKKYGKETVTLHTRMRDSPIEEVKRSMVKGDAPPSLIRTMLEDTTVRKDNDVQFDDEQLIKDLGGMLYLAGSDTTVASVVSFFLAMAVYPDVQKKAQAELDRVVGCGRLPEFSDEQELPYICGVVNECFRWLPVLTMGVPHAVVRDDEYRGYVIPKGSIVMASTWAILHNPMDYPNPETFNPERYLKVAADGSVSRDPDVRDPRTIAFGFGRRVCPGRHLAEASLFVTVATALATLHVGRVIGPDGNEKVPTVDVNSGFLSHPKPFEYTLRPRSDKALALLAVSLGL